LEEEIVVVETYAILSMAFRELIKNV